MRVSIDDIIEFCRTRRGALTAIRKRMNRDYDMTVHRTTFERWVSRNPKYRCRPMFETGLRLLEVGEKVMNEWPKHKDKKC